MRLLFSSFFSLFFSFFFCFYFFFFCFPFLFYSLPPSAASKNALKALPSVRSKPRSPIIIKPCLARAARQRAFALYWRQIVGSAFAYSSRSGAGAIAIAYLRGSRSYERFASASAYEERAAYIAQSKLLRETLAQEFAEFLQFFDLGKIALLSDELLDLVRGRVHAIAGAIAQLRVRLAEIMKLF